MVTAGDFPEFFASVNGGREPFRWQTRVVNSILGRGRWPDRISAPTGAGKSCVVEVHVFVTAVAAGERSLRLPRRLVTAVDRRALVDNQVDRAQQVANALAAASPGGLLGTIRSALQSLRTSRRPDPPPGQGQTPPDPGFYVTTLRGGVPPDPVWRDDPNACVVICATPDMWGSRALFRGYVSSRNARPRDAGLLAMDCVLVLDEAHLNRQLLTTARRIGELQRCTAEQVGVPILQIVETTATPAAVGDNTDLVDVGVDKTDWSHGGPDHALGRRLTVAKPLRLVESANWPSSSAATRKALATELAKRAVDLKSTRSGTVGVIVNTVDMAIEVKESLGAGVKAELIAGRMRPHDLAHLKGTEHPKLFTVDGDPDIDVLVATQTLEVGIDLDLAALVTELAPGSAISQRAGRVNRLGLRPDATVDVIVPLDAKTFGSRSGPYGTTDLLAGWEWLRRRASDPNGLAPWVIANDPAPDQDAPRTLWQRLELADTWVLSDTSRAHFADHDLDLWLSDQLDDDDDSVSVVVRERLPDDDNVALDLLRATPPLNRECFPARLGTARTLVNRILSDAPTSSRSRCFRVRSGAVEAIPDANQLRPGDIMVIDAVHPVCRARIVHEDPRDHAVDVYELTDDGSEPDVVRIVASDQEHDPGRRILAAVSGIISDAPKDTLNRRRSIADVIAEVTDEVAGALVDDGGTGDTAGGSLRRAASLLRGQKRSTEVQVGVPGDDASAPWMVVRSVRGRLDEELRQTWTRGALPVTLDEHSRDVENRAGQIALRLGLPNEITDALRVAGFHHDDGKADPRFQRMLQGADESQPDVAALLAKSARRTPAQNRAAQLRVSPTGWRHEQLSVLLAWTSVAADPERELILRLIGTSHGRGRGGFPHSAKELLADPADAALRNLADDVFDTGLWDELMEKTTTRYGPWGCAYLESVLRAADCQVSEEGGR